MLKLCSWIKVATATNTTIFATRRVTFGPNAQMTPQSEMTLK